MYKRHKLKGLNHYTSRNTNLGTSGGWMKYFGNTDKIISKNVFTRNQMQCLAVGEMPFYFTFYLFMITKTNKEHKKKTMQQNFHLLSVPKRSSVALYHVLLPWGTHMRLHTHTKSISGNKQRNFNKIHKYLVKTVSINISVTKEVPIILKYKVTLQYVYVYIMKRFSK